MFLSTPKYPLGSMRSLSGIFIDTENTFRPERVIQMAKAKNLDPDETLKRIHVARAYNAHPS